MTQILTEKHAYDFDLRLNDAVSTHALQFRMIPNGARVLDVGCHTGILGEALRRQKGCMVIGIDNDQDALGAARSRLDDVRCVDLERKGWATELLHGGIGEFDVVLCGDVVEHTKEPLDVLKEAKELLNSSGTIIVSLPNIANLRVRLNLLRGRFEYADSGILDRTHLRFFTRKTARELVRTAGYEIVSENYSGYSMPRWLIDLFPGLFAVNIIITARKTT